MTKTIKIKPHYPPWAKPNCEVIEDWTAPIKSGPANGVATYVRYKDAKGKVQECMKWVKWD